jgi:hypothetical protein
VMGKRKAKRGQDEAAVALKLFKERGRPYEHWLLTAQMLHRAADTIGQQDLLTDGVKGGSTATADDLPHFYSGPVFLLLAGLAMETLLKGIIVRRNPNSALVNWRLAHHLQTHDLGTLAERAAIPVSEFEKSFLKRLSAAVWWAGLYWLRRGSSHPDDLDAFRDLYQRVEKRLITEQYPTEERRH